MVTKRYRNATLEDFEPPIPGVREFLHLAESDADNPPGLVIVGEAIGVGKTHLAAAIYHALPLSYPKSWDSAGDIVDAAHAEINYTPTVNSKGYEVEREEGWLPVVRRLQTEQGIAFIDDLTAIRPTPFAMETLTRILRVRYDNELPTVVTMHSAYNEVEKMYGCALASRMMEFGRIIKLRGTDRRRESSLKAV